MSTALFHQIEELNKSMLHGWCSLTKANALAASVLTLRPETVIEIGVWSGKSLFPMALAMKSLGKGRLIGIDPWSAPASVEGLDPVNAAWWGQVAAHEEMFSYFKNTVFLLGLQNIVQIERVRSDNFTPVECQILHVDGNHGSQAIRDVIRYSPAVTVGGLLFADDVHWVGGDVERAIEKLPALGFRELYRVENKQDQWACFQKVRE